jgi:hypothetical protein
MSVVVDIEVDHDEVVPCHDYPTRCGIGSRCTRRRRLG